VRFGVFPGFHAGMTVRAGSGVPDRQWLRSSSRPHAPFEHAKPL
jgi:hypothetical protein